MKAVFQFILALGVLLLPFSCQDASDTVDYGQDGPLYVSADGAFIFRVLSMTSGPDGALTIRQENDGETYLLDRVEAASGEKYRDEAGHVFWTKGETFMWGTEDKTLASGTLRPDGYLGPQLDPAYFGNYVSEKYPQRSEGYDWVSVRVYPIDVGQVRLEIRSRADRKKPSCVYFENVRMINANTLETYIQGKTVVIFFSEGQLTIEPKTEADDLGVYFPCSGGGTIAGTYYKIEEPLDQAQIDPRTFFKPLAWQEKYTFFVQSNGEKLTFSSRGQELRNEPFELGQTGKVIDAEIGDLNLDNYPEVMIYLREEGPEAKGKVVGFSSNNGKSMSLVNFPALTEEQAQGYAGRDEFAIVENNLVRRFPVYENGMPTGITRQLQYKLQEGEAMRQLVVDKVVEY